MARVPGIIIVIGLAGLASGALAYCPSVPDGPASGNVANGTALALCQQAEIAAAAEQQRRQVQIESTLQMLERVQLAFKQQILTQPPPLPTP
jgi:hypothetical protein